MGEDAPLSQEEISRLVSRYQPGSPQAKRIDMLRSQLLYPFHGEPPRTIMITSSAPREGRSLLTSNLAISFARGLQQYVMVMDCHLTEPSQHRLLKVDRTPGLTDFLLWDAEVPDIIHWTDVDRLSVIPAGSPSNRSAEILATDKMAGLSRSCAPVTKTVTSFWTPRPCRPLTIRRCWPAWWRPSWWWCWAGVTDRELVLRSIRSLPEEKILGLVFNDMKAAVMDAPALGSLLDESE